VTDDEVDALAARAERACPGLYYVPAADFESLLAEVRRVNRLLAVKSDDIVERVERIAAHRCGDCHRQKALALEAAEKYANAHNAMKQAVVIQSEQAAEIRRLRAILTAPAPLSGNAGPCAAR
jgi:hypothetical protein